LWVEIGVNLALLAIAAMALNAGVGWFVAASSRARAGEALARQIVVVLAQQLSAEDVRVAGALHATAPPEHGRDVRVLSEGRAADPWTVVLDAYADGNGSFGPPKAAGRGGDAGAIAIAVWDAGGAVLYGRDPLPAQGRAAIATREALAWVERDVAWAVAPVGSRRDRLVGVRVPLSRAAGPAWALVVAHGLISAGLLVVFGLLLFQRRLVRPLQQLRDTTARIAGGAFGDRVVTDAPSEVMALAASLDALSLALAEYRVRTGEQVAQLGAAFDDLRRTQDALVRTERLASVGQLAAGLAHELGNPLAAVRGYVELLRADDAVAGGDPTRADVLRRCTQEVERMHVLVRRVLDFARPQAMVPAPCDLAELLADARDTLRALPGCASTSFRMELTSPVRVRVDRGRTHQVLVNLLSNAVAAGAREVSVSVRVEADAVDVTIGDDGAGIPAELQDRVFEPFFTTRPPGSARDVRSTDPRRVQGEGAGLGLAIARRLAEEQGGALTLASAPSSLGGACFVLRLRRDPDPSHR
jgi:signal transduction histidine kinase